jgi:hypothetical protein
MKQALANLLKDGPRLFKTMHLLRLAAPPLRSTMYQRSTTSSAPVQRRQYTEELLAYLVEQSGLQLTATRCDDLRWHVIDSIDHLRIAESIFANRAVLPPATAAAD